MGKHARFGQPKAPNKTHTPPHRREVLQRQKNAVQAQQFFTQLRIEREQLHHSITEGQKTISDAKALPETYENTKDSSVNEERLKDAKFISEISQSLPKPSFLTRTKSMRKDLASQGESQKILKGAYLLTLKKIQSEYASASVFSRVASYFSSTINNVENSKLFCLVRDGLGGKGTVVSEDQQIEWLQALQTHMANPHVQEQLRVAGVDVVAMAELVEQQLEELQPRIAATI